MMGACMQEAGKEGLRITSLHPSALLSRVITQTTRLCIISLQSSNLVFLITIAMVVQLSQISNSMVERSLCL